MKIDTIYVMHVLHNKIFIKKNLKNDKKNLHF